MLALRKPTLVAVVLGALLNACGHSSSSGSFGALDGSAKEVGVAAQDAAGVDAMPGSQDSSSPPPVDASTSPDAVADADEAGAVASLCVGIGVKCKDSTTCLCGVGSACTFDNVDCTGGVCAVSFPVPLDAGVDCCAGCQSTYDGCTSSSQECLSQWTTCNDACPGECPVLCLAAQGTPGG
jgi:hypothetical protein